MSVFNLVLAATNDQNILLYIEARREKDVLPCDKSNCIKISLENALEFYAETQPSLISEKRWHASRKVSIWKQRLGQEIEFFKHLGKRKSFNSRANVVIADAGFVTTITGQHETRYKRLKNGGIYDTKLHQGLKKECLPRSLITPQHDIDSLWFAKKFDAFFRSPVSHQTLANAVRKIPSMISELVQHGKSIKERPNLSNQVTGAIANRFFSHCGWSMAQPQPIDNSRISQTDMAVDIDQITLHLTNFEFSEKANNHSGGLFATLERIDQEIKEEVISTIAIYLYLMYLLCRFFAISWAPQPFH